MTDIDGHLYAGATRLGTSTNPVYVTFADSPPSEFIPTFAPPQTFTKIIETQVERVKEVPVYNIHGNGILFNIWYKIGTTMRWVDGS